MHVHPVVDLKRALYGSIGIKLVLHLSVWSVSSLLSVTYPSVFSCLPFLYIAFLETNSFELIARNHFHCRFLSGGLQWFNSPHIAKAESWKSRSKNLSLIITSFRKIWKSTLMNSLGRKPGQRSQDTAIVIKFFPQCAIRKRTSFYSYQEKQHKQISHYSVILMGLMLKTLFFSRKRKYFIGCQGEAWSSGSWLGKKNDQNVLFLIR